MAARIVWLTAKAAALALWAYVGAAVVAVFAMAGAHGAAWPSTLAIAVTIAMWLFVTVKLVARWRRRYRERFSLPV